MCYIFCQMLTKCVRVLACLMAIAIATRPFFIFSFFMVVNDTQKKSTNIPNDTNTSFFIIICVVCWMSGVILFVATPILACFVCLNYYLMFDFPYSLFRHVVFKLEIFTRKEKIVKLVLNNLFVKKQKWMQQ